MANVKEIVQDKDRAEALAHLQELFEKPFDLTTQAGRQGLVEGLGEFGKHAALTCSQATISIQVGANGLTGVVLSSTPNPV